MSTNTNPVDQRILDLARISYPIELVAGVTGTIEDTARAGVHHTKIVLTADLDLIIGGDAAAKGGGVALFQFPAGKIVPQCSRIKGRLTLSNSAMSTTAGEIGLGTVEATGAIATLSTGTFEDITTGGVPALANIAADGTISFSVYDGGRSVTPAAAAGVSPTVYINAATTFANSDPANLTLLAGSEIEFWWIHMEQ